jgi:hypothetical protein
MAGIFRVKWVLLLVTTVSIMCQGVYSQSTQKTPDLSLSMSHQGNFRVGRKGTYTVTVRNLGEFLNAEMEIDIYIDSFTRRYVVCIPICRGAVKASALALRSCPVLPARLHQPQ